MEIINRQPIPPKIKRFFEKNIMKVSKDECCNDILVSGMKVCDYFDIYDFLINSPDFNKNKNLTTKFYEICSIYLNQSNRTNEAVQLIDQGIEKNVFGCYTLKGKIYLDNKEYDMAIECFKEAIEHRQWGARIQLAMTYKDIQKTEEMEKLIDEIIKYDRNENNVWWAYYILIEVSINRSDWNKVDDLFPKVIKNDDNNWKLYRLFSKTDENIHLKYLNKGIEVGSTIAMLKLGNYYAKKGDNKNMKKYLKMAYHKSRNACERLGDHYKGFSKNTKMIFYYRRGLCLGSKSCLTKLITYYKHIGDISNWLKDCQTAINLKIPSCNREMAHYYKYQNDKELWLKYLLKAYTSGGEQNVQVDLRKFLSKNLEDNLDLFVKNFTILRPVFTKLSTEQQERIIEKFPENTCDSCGEVKNILTYYCKHKSCIDCDIENKRCTMCIKI